MTLPYSHHSKPRFAPPTSYKPGKQEQGRSLELSNYNMNKSNYGASDFEWEEDEKCKLEGNTSNYELENQSTYA
jgi:hypothetical protein